MDSGAVDEAAAASMMEKMEAYRALQAASAGMDSTAMDADLTAEIDMAYSQDGETVSMPMSMDGSMQMILDADDLRMAYKFDIGILGETMTMGEWVRDGWAYMEMTVDGETVRTKTQVDLEEQLALLEQMEGTTSMAATSVSGLAMVDSIGTESRNGSTIYTVVLGGASMNGMLSGVMGTLMGETGMEESLAPITEAMEFGDVTAVYTVGRDGRLDSVDMVYSVTMDGAVSGRPHRLPDIRLQHLHDHQRHRQRCAHHLPRLLRF